MDNPFIHQYDKEVIIVVIETRHDLEGNPVPVAIDYDRNEYICSFQTLANAGYDSGRMQRMQSGARHGVTFKAIVRSGEIVAGSVVRTDLDTTQKKTSRDRDPFAYWREFSGFLAYWEDND